MTDTQSKPVAAASLKLTAQSVVKPIDATSGPDGLFVFPSLPSGEYEIHAAAPGFTEIKKTVRLGDGQSLTVDLQVQGLTSRTDPDSYCVGVPNKEFRLAVTRPLLSGRMNVGVKNFATDNQPGYAGTLPVPENPIAEVVGVRIPSCASLSVTCKFGR